MRTIYQSELLNDLEVRKKLKLLDNLCTNDSVTASFIIVGGAALILTMALHNKDFRATRDIDISSIELSDKDKLNKYFNLLGISTRADGVLFPTGDEIYQQGEYIEFKDDYKSIRVYLVTPEMLVVLKAFTSRKKDLEDILNQDLLEIIDPQKTIEMIEEYKSYNIFTDDPNTNLNEILSKLKEM